MNRGTFRCALLHGWAALAVGWLAASSSPCRAQSATAAQQRLERVLDAPVSLAWQGQELAAGLGRLAEAHGIAVWIDRRIDPQATIDVEVHERPLREALAAVTASREWAAVPYRGVLYVGPRQSAEELATLAELARQSLAAAPAAARARWLRSEPWSLPKLSEPRALLKELAASAQTKVAHEALVPHDLWPARSLPALPAIDRAVLLLVGFDLTCSLSPDGRTLRVAPIARPVLVERRYTIARPRQAAFAAELAALGLQTAARPGQGSVVVEATAEQHQRLQAALSPAAPQRSAGAARPPAPASTKRFTLRIENQPAGGVVAQLAQQLGLEVEWLGSPAAADAARARRVSCDVREVDLDGLLSAVLAPAGLAFERADRKLEIRQAP